MTIRHAIWKVGPKPEPLAPATLPSERLLEDMIVAAPGLLAQEWMLIGRQESTGFGGRIDLLAVAPDGALVLIEIKRDRSPREVVAQALDYACWVERLDGDEIAAIYERFAPGHSLKEDFRARFGQPLDEEALNQSHQIVIVAGELDESSERIVTYLSKRELPINVLCFQVFAQGEEQLLSRAWLLDPLETQASAAGRSDRAKEPWNGEFYLSFGHNELRSWADARHYGFVCAGGGSWYSKTLGLLEPGDRVWVKVPGAGFVGVGRVTGKPEPAATFRVTTADGSELPLLEAPTEGDYRRFAEDEERSEYFVPVRWLQTVGLDEAFNEIGLFGNQNTVCKPTTPKWRHTVERLKQRFPNFEG